MPKKLPKQTVFVNPNRTCRSFMFLLYPDSESYNCEQVISTIASWFDEVSYILHDQDIYLDGPEVGNVKKPHFHVVCRSASPKRGQSVADTIGVSSRFIQYCDNFRLGNRYLLHLDNKEKFQYNINSVFTNVSQFSKYCNVDVDKGELYMTLISYVRNNNVSDFFELAEFAGKNGLLLELRSYYPVLRDLIFANQKKKE